MLGQLDWKEGILLCRWWGTAHLLSVRYTWGVVYPFTMGNHAPITVVERSPHCGRQSSEMERTRGLDFFELLNQSPWSLSYPGLFIIWEHTFYYSLSQFESILTLDSTENGNKWNNNEFLRSCLFPSLRTLYKYIYVWMADFQGIFWEYSLLWIKVESVYWGSVSYWALIGPFSFLYKNNQQDMIVEFRYLTPLSSLLQTCFPKVWLPTT